jgi:hypothetical protein
MRYKTFNINYDTDGKVVELPTEMTFSVDPDLYEFEPSTDLADMISNKTGWCINTFEFEEIPREYYTFGECPEDIIKEAVTCQCPDGYNMTIKDDETWGWIAACVNEGIDSHLEALTLRSTFDNGACLVHPEELHVLLRRLLEMGWNQTEDQIEGIADSPHGLRSSILSTLDIEEV